jgi:hypothetical protein
MLRDPSNARALAAQAGIVLFSAGVMFIVALILSGYLVHTSSKRQKGLYITA